MGDFSDGSDIEDADYEPLLEAQWMFYSFQNDDDDFRKRGKPCSTTDAEKKILHATEDRLARGCSTVSGVFKTLY